MCDRLRRAAMIASLLLGATGTGQAQTVAEFRQRLDALSRLSRRISDTLAVMRRSPVRALPVDTIRIGALVVVAAHSVSDHARPGVDSAWSMLSRLYGARAGAVERTPITLQYADQKEGELPADEFREPPVWIPRHASVNEVAARILAGASPAIYRSVDPQLQEWVPHPYAFTIRGSTSIRDSIPSGLFAELATSPWRSTRECFDGRLDACRRALGISGKDPVLDWFDAADRRHYAENHLKSLPASQSRYATCRSGDDAACIALMRLAPRPRPEPPLGVTTRLLLLALALDAGGRSAFDRLLDRPTDPLDARLAAAAGMPVDSLIGRWRARVIAAHPKTVAADERAAWGAVAWGVLFALMALRSTRWR